MSQATKNNNSWDQDPRYQKAAEIFLDCPKLSMTRSMLTAYFSESEPTTNTIHKRVRRLLKHVKTKQSVTPSPTEEKALTPPTEEKETPFSLPKQIRLTSTQKSTVRDNKHWHDSRINKAFIEACQNMSSKRTWSIAVTCCQLTQ